MLGKQQDKKYINTKLVISKLKLENRKLKSSKIWTQTSFCRGNWNCQKKLALHQEKWPPSVFQENPCKSLKIRQFNMLWKLPECRKR